MNFGVPSEAKALAVAATLAVLWIAERRISATPSGRAGVRHDVRNLAFGAGNAALGAALACWVLPPVPGRSGLLGLLSPPPWLAVVAGVVLLDLWMYVWHRANHVVPLLWRFHRVHHSDPAMNASTALRTHPGEALFSALLRVPVVSGLGVGIETLLLYEFILLPVILFHHSNVRIPAAIERMLRSVVVTPGLHRVHHSPLQVETDSNFASVLSIWDRLAGTLRPTRIDDRDGYGLRGLDGPSWQSALGMASTPFRSTLNRGAPPQRLPYEARSRT